jgi:hypothetical protein
VKSYLEQALEQAEQKIAKGDFRKGLGKLDNACWNVSAADSVEEFDRIRELAERVVERTDGRLAKKAQALVGLTEERRTAYLEGRVPKGLVPKTATVPVIAKLITSLIGLTSIWAIITLVYYIKASQALSFFGTCGPGAGPSGGIGQEGNWAGAGYSSATAAAAMGGMLWVAAAVAAWRFRARRGTVVLAYATIYIVALVVLWYFVSPTIWGPEHCSA